MLHSEKKKSLLDSLAKYVLTQGLRNANLKSMARACNTSDRMLVYYFGSKEDLIRETINHIAKIVNAELDAALPSSRPTTRRQAVIEIVNVLNSDRVQSFGPAWFEMLSLAAAGEEFYAQVGHEVEATLLKWLESRLPISEDDPVRTAAALLTIIEGAQVLKVLRLDRTAEAAVSLLLVGETE